MSSPGTLRFGQIFSTPSAPPVGYDLIYVKTDNVLYIQDSSGTEVALGSASAITTLTGDVTGTGPGSTATTVAFVGGQSAANIAAAVVSVEAATPANTPSTLVERDGSGNFSAGTITATLNGNASTATSAASSINFSGSLTGDVTGTQSATVVGYVGGQTAAAVATTVTEVASATSMNTASTLVERDASGNFSANIITGTLNGNASTATTSVNFSGSLSGDVTGTQSATVVSTVGGQSAANVATTTTTVAAATSANTPSTLVERDGSGNFAAGTITASLIGNVTGNLAGNVTGGTITGLIHSMGFQRTSVGKTSAYTATINDDIIGVDASGGAVTITLPPASTANVYTIVKTDSSVNVVTIVPSAGDNISGFSSVTLHNQYDVYTLGADGIHEYYIDSAVIGGAVGPLTALTGDVSAVGPGSAVATVNSVGGQTAAAVAFAATQVAAATSADTPSTLVLRDASGNFSAGTITANLTGTASGNVTSITAGQGLSGGTITTSGTIALAEIAGPGFLANASSGFAVPIATTLSSMLDAVLGTTQGAIIYRSNILWSTLLPGTAGEFLETGGTGANPSWAAVSTSGLTGTTLPSNIVSSSLTSVGTITSGVWNGTPLTAPYMLPLANGEIYVGNGSNQPAAVAVSGDIAITDTGVTSVVATTNSTLTTLSALSLPGSQVTGNIAGDAANITATTNSTLTTLSALALPTLQLTGTIGLTTQVSGVLPIANGGTDISTVPTNGQLLIGNGTGYTLSTLTAGTGISVADAAGSITITNTQITALVTKTANYTILSTDGTILCDTSGGAFTLTLPSPTGLAGKLFRVIDSTGFFQINNLTLAPSGSEKIEGLAASKVLQTPWGWFTITTNGTDWWCG